MQIFCLIIGPITPQNTGFVAVQQTAGRVNKIFKNAFGLMDFV
jgi:hypothetical protein